MSKFSPEVEDVLFYLAEQFDWRKGALITKKLKVLDEEMERLETLDPAIHRETSERLADILMQVSSTAINFAKISELIEETLDARQRDGKPKERKDEDLYLN